MQAHANFGCDLSILTSVTGHETTRLSAVGMGSRVSSKFVGEAMTMPGRGIEELVIVVD